ncbi:MAG TPA: hypothetical protein VGR70_22155 [Stellaceae bacterium]|nr:hypothetical protein [Stellaceae bacterium]
METALSKERLDTYRELLPAGATFIDVIGIYNANTAISEALIGSIQIMEISVRNSIHRQIARTYGIDWYVGNKLNLDNDTPETLSQKIVSELTLGFWTNLFKRQYEDPLWRKTLRFAFPHVGGPLTRGQVHQTLDKLRRLRNRISHHEQILKYDLNVYYNSIIDLVSWVSPVTAIWLSHHNRFYDVMDQYNETLAIVAVEAKLRAGGVRG